MRFGALNVPPAAMVTVLLVTVVKAARSSVEPVATSNVVMSAVCKAGRL